MVSQALDVVDCLLTDRLEYRRPCWVIATAEHEVLPNQHAQLVTGLVESIVLVDTAAPDTENVS